jgi:RHS repeat-associated protein
VGNALTGYAWFDPAGNVIKQQAAGTSLFTKTTYDSLGRVSQTFTGYDTSEPLPMAITSSSSSSSSASSSGPSSYDCAIDISDDTILQQSQTQYDPAGNVILTTAWRRLNNATGTGELSSPSGTQPLARTSYMAYWYDGVNRQTATANYGTNGGTAPTCPSSAPPPSDTVLVTSTAYDSTGQAYQSTDPAGQVTLTVFDQAGRKIQVIRNYIATTSSSSSSSCSSGDCSGSDQNVTVETTYNADGQILTLTATNPVTGDQVTQYVYGSTLVESGVARSDLLRAVIYPDSDDTASPLGNGPDGIYDRVEYCYNRQGERTQMKDQNGTVHAYLYDLLGRQLEDQVTVLGTGIDGSVQRITTSYEVRGFVETITSYNCLPTSSSSSSSSSGSAGVVNQVQFVYNSFGQLVTDYQEHGGAVNTSTSLNVQYDYADGSAGTNRLTQITYPNGRVLLYGYNSGTDDAVNRVSYLEDQAGSSAAVQLAAYSYLGLGGIVQVNYAQPQIRYDLAFGTGNDPNVGLDQFDRVVDLRWYNYATSTDVERVQHGYDCAGNRLWRQCPVATSFGQNFDELYAYDGVDQLIERQRGQLNANQTAITAENFAEQWSLDPTGNWCLFQQDTTGDGTWDLDQSRSHDMANEITQIAGSNGQVGYDLAGNMTMTPQPGNWSASYTLTFDAWNRLVTAINGATIVAQYAYDGRKFRVSKTASGTTRHYYYSSQWQVLEERIGSSPGSVSPDRQNVWGFRYVDDLVLRDRNADGNGGTGNLGITGSGLEERLYCLQDPNWNVVGVADTTGAMQERYCYTAYGKPTFLTAAFGSRGSSSYAWDALYTGRQFDAETGFGYYRNRYYGIDRFLSRDPMGYRGGPNLYEYVGNTPLWAVDPAGSQRIRFPTPLPPPTTPAMQQCTFLICGTQVGPGGIGMHTFLVVPDDKGGYQGYRGGPSGGQNTPGCNAKNQLLVTDGPWGDKFPDAPKPDDKFKPGCITATLQYPGGCAGIRSCFSEMSKRINKCCIPYDDRPNLLQSGVKGCNCNCVTSWLMTGCGIRLPTVSQLPKLGGIGGSPYGWGWNLPDSLKKPADKDGTKCPCDK